MIKKNHVVRILVACHSKSNLCPSTVLLNFGRKNSITLWNCISPSVSFMAFISSGMILIEKYLLVSAKGPGKHCGCCLYWLSLVSSLISVFKHMSFCFYWLKNRKAMKKEWQENFNENQASDEDNNIDNVWLLLLFLYFVDVIDCCVSIVYYCIIAIIKVLSLGIT